MPHFQATRRVAVPAATAYAVAADVAQYKSFLPLLTRSQVRPNRQEIGGRTVFDAELTVAYEKMGLRESFLSKVACDPAAGTVTATSSDGPFKSLTAVWSIVSSGPSSCDVKISIDYEVHSFLLQMALRAAMDMAVQKVMAAFEARALQLARPVSLA